MTLAPEIMSVSDRSLDRFSLRVEWAREFVADMEPPRAIMKDDGYLHTFRGPSVSQRRGPSP